MCQRRLIPFSRLTDQLRTYDCLYFCHCDSSFTANAERILNILHKTVPFLRFTVTIMVKVDVEYCGKCNFEWQCKMLQIFLQEQKPDTEMVCHKGRQGSFEVKINEQLVHSKLQSLAFPDHQSVLENVKRAEDGQPMVKTKEQPIDNCALM